MQQRGITIIELLVAIAILSILAAIALPVYLRATVRARYAQATAIAYSLKVPILEYRLKTGEFPPDRLRNEPPIGVRQCQGEAEAGCWMDAVEMPFASPLDYENWQLEGDRCFVAISWLGQNARRDTAVGTFAAGGDDVMLRIAVERC